jgi:hypothetical protein
MNIDTNQIAQAAADAVAIKAQVQANWPAIAACAVVVARELGNFNTWCAGIAEWIIKHGGIGMLVKKLLWNPTQQ